MPRDESSSLQAFYDSFQGKVARRLISQLLRHHWRNLQGLRLLGWGHAVPYLRPYLPECAGVIALTPFATAKAWPEAQRNIVAVAEKDRWPVESNSIDRLLIVHGANSADMLDSILKESWRVLKGDGRLLLVAPNRSGAWAWFDNTPFGHGTPYTMGQLRGHLRDCLFTPTVEERALFVPPVSSRMLLSTAPAWEKAGRALFSGFGGVHVVEAQKQLYSPTPLPVGARPAALRPKTVPAGGKYDSLPREKRQITDSKQ